MERVNVAVIANCGSETGTSVYVFKEMAKLYENVAKIIFMTLDHFKNTEHPFEVEADAVERINQILELINNNKYEEAVALYNNTEDDSLLMSEYTDVWIDLYPSCSVI